MRKLIIITGGTSGIGLQLAISLAREYDLALIYRQDVSKAEKAAEQLNEIPSSSFKTFKKEVIDDESAEKVYQLIKNYFNKTPYALINCAGDTKMELFLNSDHKLISNMFASHVLGVMAITRLVIEDMYLQKTGKIITFSSIASSGDQRGMSIYCSVKNAIEGFTRALSTEVNHKNISVNCIRPGIVKLPGEDLSSKHSKMIDPLLICQYVKKLLDEEQISTTGTIQTIN